MTLLFYPRGGSAQVAGYLAMSLQRHGIDVRLACGSLGSPGDLGHAGTFFPELDPLVYSYDAAVAAWERGEDPMDAPQPMHPSFEVRSGVPDRAFTLVSPEQGDHLAHAWAQLLASDEQFMRSDVLHLHHMTPIHDAVATLGLEAPIVTHLHGTDLKMLEAIETGRLPEHARHYADHWRERLRNAAHSSSALIVISPHDRDEAAALVGVPDERVHWIPNGVDTTRFSPQRLSNKERRSLWKQWLVDDPQGWDEASQQPGSIRYNEAVLERFIDPDSDEHNPVLLFVGRFIEFKRVPMLIRAYAAAREHFTTPAPLVIWGGSPGEWEGEHPHTVAQQVGDSDIFFAGWRGHADLPTGLAASDVLVAPSFNESFGQVYIEAMACGLPVIATASGGPLSFVNVDAAAPDGWMIAVDDQDALTRALIDAVNEPTQRAAFGSNGVRHATERFSWDSLATQFQDLYADVTSTTTRVS